MNTIKEFSVAQLQSFRMRNQNLLEGSNQPEELTCFFDSRSRQKFNIFSYWNRKVYKLRKRTSYNLDESTFSPNEFVQSSPQNKPNLLYRFISFSVKVTSQDVWLVLWWDSVFELAVVLSKTECVATGLFSLRYYFGFLQSNNRQGWSHSRG